MAVTYSILYQDVSTQGKNVNSVQIAYSSEAYTGQGLPLDGASLGCPVNIDSVVVYDSAGFPAAFSKSSAVTFQDAGDTVTLNAHGLSNGAVVRFSSIASTTGISANTSYYVVGAAANTFQLAASPGGSALALTTDGTGVLENSGKLRLYKQDGTTGALAEVSGNQTITVKVIATGW